MSRFKNPLGIAKQLKAIEDATFNYDRMSLASITRFLKKDNYILEFSNSLDIIGYIFYSIYKNSIRIYNVVSKEKGLGSALVGAICAMARDLGKRRVTLECKESLVPFYQKLGFTVFDKVEDYYEDHSSCYRMWRFLI